MSGEQSVQASPALSQGTVVAGRYEIVKLIGEGSFGEVYLAKNRLGGEVVVKMLKRDFNRRDDIVRRFLREPRAAASVQSQHVVQVTDAGTVMKKIVVKGETVEVPDYHFLVMERLRGEDLSETLANKGRLEPREALHIILAVLDGLHDVHALGIVHRDLKPENIFLILQKRSLPGVKIMDFGIAHTEDDSPDQHRLTRTESSMGTPAYMAPEQWRDPTKVDHRADIYAVGAVLYELLEGVLPFQGATPEAALMASVTESPREMLAADADLQAIVSKAMQVEPSKRFQNASAMVQALEEYARRRCLLPEAGNSTPVTPTPTAPVRAQAETGLAFVSDMSVPLRRSRPLLVALAAAALTCGVILGVITFGGRQSSQPTRAAASPPVSIPATPVTSVPGPVAVEPPPATPPTPSVEPAPVAPVVARPVVEPPPPRSRTERGQRHHRNNTAPSAPPARCVRGPDGENICG